MNFFFKKRGWLAGLGWPNHPLLDRRKKKHKNKNKNGKIGFALGGGRTTLVALGGGPAIPKGQNRSLFFLVKGWLWGVVRPPQTGQKGGSPLAKMGVVAGHPHGGQGGWLNHPPVFLFFLFFLIFNFNF
jgi:hypothetical protein